MAVFETLTTALHHTGLISRGQRLLLAVSGGIDSMALLHMFHRLKDEWNLELTVAHINHQLRGRESDDDEEFVRQHSSRLTIPFVSQRVDVKRYQQEHNCTVQVAARALRYRALNELREQVGAEWIVTAHNANDNAETVLMNIIRGSGLHGLTGIPARNLQQRCIRPLLTLTRHDIERYVQEYHIPYRNDSSNNTLHYERNIIRNVVLPELEKRYRRNMVDILNALSLMALQLEQQLNEVLTPLLTTALTTSEHKVTLDLAALNHSEPFLQDELFYVALTATGIEPTEHRIHTLHSLCKRPVGRIATLTSDVHALRDRTTLIIERTHTHFTPVEISLGREYSFPTFTFSATPTDQAPASLRCSEETVYIDATKVGNRLVLRPWHHGDWFIPLGMKHPKKLSDFFIDSKLSRFEKYEIPILESDGTIVWICGKRLDERFKVTPQTQQYIKLTYQQRRKSYGAQNNTEWRYVRTLHH